MGPQESSSITGVVVVAGVALLVAFGRWNGVYSNASVIAATDARSHGGLVSAEAHYRKWRYLRDEDLVMLSIGGYGMRGAGLRNGLK